MPIVKTDSALLQIDKRISVGGNDLETTNNNIENIGSTAHYKHDQGIAINELAIGYQYIVKKDIIRGEWYEQAMYKLNLKNKENIKIETKGELEGFNLNACKIPVSVIIGINPAILIKGMHKKEVAEKQEVINNYLFGLFSSTSDVEGEDFKMSESKEGTQFIKNDNVANVIAYEVADVCKSELFTIFHNKHETLVEKIDDFITPYNGPIKITELKSDNEVTQNTPVQSKEDQNYRNTVEENSYTSIDSTANLTTTFIISLAISLGLLTIKTLNKLNPHTFKRDEANDFYETLGFFIKNTPMHSPPILNFVNCFKYEIYKHYGKIIALVFGSTGVTYTYSNYSDIKENKVKEEALLKEVSKVDNTEKLNYYTVINEAVEELKLETEEQYHSVNNEEL